jgi:puromycin-sensitive aminopeptidase
LEDSTGQPVRALMDTWIFQAGYPLIHVEKDPLGIVLSQRIFRYLPASTAQEPTWHVPILLRGRTKSGMIDKIILLTDREARVESGEYEWVMVNAGGHGFYRVSYSPELMTALQQHLRTRLLPAERFGLLSDTWATTLAGLTSLPDYLKLLEIMRDETDLNVWTTVIGSAHHIHRILEEQQYPAFAERFRTVLLPAVERLGWTARSGESELEGQLRGDLIAALGTLGEDKSCQERARGFHTQFEQEPASVDRNLVPALVAIVAHTGTETDYEDFYSRFKNAQTPQEEQRYLFALANFRRPHLIERTLQLTINGEVRTQNAPYLMRGLLLNRYARQSAWPFLKAHWQEMVRQYPDNSIPRMCEGIIGLVTRELEADVKAFFASHPVKQGVKQMEQHLERLHIAVLCKERWDSLLQG